VTMFEQVALQRAQVDAHIAHAEQFSQNGDTAAAIAMLRTAASTCEEAEDAPRALELWLRVVRLDGSYDARLRVAQLQRRVGRRREAAVTFEVLAEESIARGWLQHALEGYVAAVEAEPRPDRRLRLAQLALQHGMTAEAVVQLDLAGAELAKAGRIDALVDVSRRMLAIAPDHVPTLRRLARVQLDRGQHDAAVASIHTALRAAPRDYEALELMAEAFVAYGKIEQATEVIYLLVQRRCMEGSEGEKEAMRLLLRGLAWAPEDEALAGVERELRGERITPARRPIVVPEGTEELDLTDFAEITVTGHEVSSPGRRMPEHEGWITAANEAIEELDPDEVAMLVDDETASRYAVAGGQDPQWYMEAIGLG
jgi:tetratricopeptide (TPR) repeat protein